MYKILFYLLVLSFAANAQAQKVEKKNVSVDVQMTKEGQRHIKVTAYENGELKTYAWTDNGTVPDDIKKQLADDNIDIKILESEAGDDREITIDVDATVMKPEKQIIMIKKIDKGDDAEEIYEWNGEGEMPSEMQELLDEHNIEIGSMGNGDTRIKQKLEESQEIRKKMRVKAMRKGHEQNMKTESQYKIISIDDNGGKKVTQWTGAETPEGMDDVHEEIKIMVDDTDGEANIFMFKSDDKPTLSDAYMGAHISSEGGAKIVEIQKDSPAARANLQVGDIVKRLNGARVRNMENLLDLLKYYEPNDQLELLIDRDGGDKKIKLTLGTRPKQFRL